MDKLTEIKKYHNDGGFAFGIDTIGMRYISWLIEQAEKVNDIENKKIENKQ